MDARVVWASLFSGVCILAGCWKSGTKREQGGSARDKELLQSQLDAMKAEVDEVNAQLGLINTELKGIVPGLDAAKVEVDKAKSELGLVKAEVGEVRSELDALKARLAEEAEPAEVPEGLAGPGSATFPDGRTRRFKRLWGLQYIDFPGGGSGLAASEDFHLVHHEGGVKKIIPCRGISKIEVPPKTESYQRVDIVFESVAGQRETYPCAANNERLFVEWHDTVGKDKVNWKQVLGVVFSAD